MPDRPESPRPHGSDSDRLGEIFNDFPLDADLRELYLRLRLDGAIWRSQQPEDDSELAAYALALAEEAPTYVDLPSLEFDEPRAAPAARKLPERSRRVHAFIVLGDVGMFIAVAAIVALVSVTLLRLSPLAQRIGPGIGLTPVPTETATVTPAPTAIPTATPRPEPTAIPWVAFAPYIVSLNGHRIEEYLMRNGSQISCSPDSINFQVLIKYTHSKPGTFTFEWRFYDGGQPVDSPSVNYNPLPEVWTPLLGSTTNTDPAYNGEDFQVTWYLTAQQLTATPRWGAQFVITEVNGKTLATPITTPIVALPTPAC